MHTIHPESDSHSCSPPSAPLHAHRHTPVHTHLLHTHPVTGVHTLSLSEPAERRLGTPCPSSPVCFLGTGHDFPQPQKLHQITSASMRYSSVCPSRIYHVPIHYLSSHYHLQAIYLPTVFHLSTRPPMHSSPTTHLPMHLVTTICLSLYHLATYRLPYIFYLTIHYLSPA